MSEETSSSNVSSTLKPEGTDSECVRDSFCSDSETANELFDSFMEIVNDPEYQDKQDDQGTLDQQAEVNGTLDQQAEVNGTLDQQAEVNGTLDQQAKVNGTLDQQAEVNGRVDQQAEVNGTLDQPVEVNGTLDQQAEVDGTVNEQKSAMSNSDAGEPVEDDSSCGESKPINAVDQVNAECKLEQSNDTEKENSSNNKSDPESNPDSKQNMVDGESRSDDVNRTTGNSDTDSPGGDKAVPSTTEEISADTQKDRVLNSADSGMDVQDASPNEQEQPAEKSDEQNNDPDSVPNETAKRFSKAMEDLEGLERVLCSAVAEFQRSNSVKEREVREQEKATSDAENSPVSAQDSEQDTCNAALCPDTREDEAEVVDDGVNKSSTDEGENSVEEEDNLQNASSVSDTVVVANDLEEMATTEPSSESTCDANKKENLDQIEGALLDNNGEAAVPNICKDENKTAGNTTEVQMDGSEEGMLATEELSSAAEKAQDENNPVEQAELANKGGLPEPKNTNKDGDSRVETVVSDECSGQDIAVGATINQEESSIKESNSEEDLDLEVANVCMSIPEIEIVTTDESGISERKSLDSLDTEGSSNSRPASPAFSDEGIDSDADALSDFGDDEEDTLFDPEALENSRRKSWLLETDRNRLSSDSSTVSEKEFKDHYSKGDGTDGKPTKDRIRGHLLKMGGSGLTPKNWRKRWIVIKEDNCLYYYKHSKDKAPCGVIVLSNYSVSKAPEVSKRHCFKLTKGGARTYYMCAGSEADRKQWMVALIDSVKDSQNESNPFQIAEGNLHNVSIPALSIRDPDCHGYLFKQGDKIKIWRRRYFVLKNGFLYYYSDMSNTVALGVAKLHGYAIHEGDQNGKKFCFSAVSRDSSTRTYFFAAESDMDRKRWLPRLEESIKKGCMYA